MFQRGFRGLHSILGDLHRGFREISDDLQVVTMRFGDF